MALETHSAHSRGRGNQESKRTALIRCAWTPAFAGVSGENYARVSHTLGVMAGLVPAIHDLSHARQLMTWMPATTAGMTEERQCGHKAGHDRGEAKKVVDARIKPGMTGESSGVVARSGAAFC